DGRRYRRRLLLEGVTEPRGPVHGAAVTSAPSAGVGPLIGCASQNGEIGSFHRIRPRCILEIAGRLVDYFSTASTERTIDEQPCRSRDHRGSDGLPDGRLGDGPARRGGDGGRVDSGRRVAGRLLGRGNGGAVR